MESTASTAGRVARAASSTTSRSRPGANPTSSTEIGAAARRDATWARDSSPETSRHAVPAGDERAEQVEHEGRLPDARWARQHDDRSRNEAATEDAVKARHPGPIRGSSSPA